MNPGSYTRYYSPDKLVSKVKTVKTNFGRGIIRAVVTLYVILQQTTTPVWVKAIIVGALGYFICPFDLVPDFLPIGFADDLVVITTILRNLYMYKPYGAGEFEQIAWGDKSLGEKSPGCCLILLLPCEPIYRSGYYV